MSQQFCTKTNHYTIAIALLRNSVRILPLLTNFKQVNIVFLMRIYDIARDHRIIVSENPVTEEDYHINLLSLDFAELYQITRELLS